MRIKTYTAATMEKAMSRVRLEMGDEAIILSTQNMTTGEVQLTAAVEQNDTPPAPPIADNWAMDWDKDWKTDPQSPPPPRRAGKTALNREIATLRDNGNEASAPTLGVTPKMELLVQSMAYHGLPTLLAEKLCRMALAVKSGDTTIALAAALDSHYKYSSRIQARKTPLMLVGPPGVGKTVTIAKFAAAAKMEGRKVHLITTDTSRPGAIDQLQSYADILEFKLHVIATDRELENIAKSPELSDGSDILIDTGGINIYDADEVSGLTRKIIAAKAEPVAVLAAGTDTAEMSDTAEIFAALGARRMIVTRLDTTRRYGGIFTAAHTANLSFSYASVSPSVATGLHVITPVNLARLLLRDPTETGVGKEFDKVKS
ncbi:hypothetical protein [Sneathiella sp.]|uniref:flagellar biosynthesis protein FlhF n=1 Tax=Sneathiella sp. TaxID=1964365 RepID=UPI003564A39B